MLFRSGKVPFPSQVSSFCANAHLILMSLASLVSHAPVPSGVACWLLARPWFDRSLGISLRECLLCRQGGAPMNTCRFLLGRAPARPTGFARQTHFSQPIQYS